MANYIYGLTVQGIQSYIFATNNLREIIGASEIIEDLCTTLFTSFCNENAIKDVPFLKAAGNIRIVTSKEKAQLLFTSFHKRVLDVAPGLPFSQAAVEYKNDNSFDELEQKLNGQRNLPMQDFDLNCMGRLIARSTGNAAVIIGSSHEEKYLLEKRLSIDIVTKAKFEKGDHPRSLEDKITSKPADRPFIKKFDEMANEGKHSWLALVHIDGNGMGNRIREIRKKDGFNVVMLNEFSKNVEKATVAAFNLAFKSEILSKIESTKIPFRPIVLGGDDVTAIMRADLALPFVNTYMKEFENKTEIELEAFDGKLTACAGIAYVKDKFPFHYSADLAEELCKYAKKKSDRKASCVQFHKVSDSFIENYEEIIVRELSTPSYSFSNGPYYLSTLNPIDKIISDCQELRKEESPESGMREWVDVAFNNPTMTSVIMNRMKKKYPTSIDIIDNNKSYIDYLSILAVS